jgi:hypothetical protein
LVDNLPNGFVMEQNYPNPFNPETSIRFALKDDTKATLKVYNSLGAEIATLFDGTAEAGRYYDVKFGGSELASGFYIYKLVAGEYRFCEENAFDEVEYLTPLFEQDIHDSKRWSRYCDKILR